MILKDYLKNQKMKQKDFAKLINVSSATICLLVNRKVEPSLSLATKITEITNNQVSYQEMLRV